ncbi:non-ribosomal peptide synthetase [Allocoleopsis franciscana]|uniref:Amino acid adenylation enzyme/thioester reductase family protein n=1 Tax=Allocoleopsis franciscana PCC 7113 TaxID=1173027 RepID=K9WDN0_9CYAN|nr:non-ribosomal peptide synthetase [Allocoleopsis franciscana]AFZ17607.1 amino acid adenylation enzyme/thioester reductase family protein [Allocoleopsis franciscana PCC 7113]
MSLKNKNIEDVYPLSPMQQGMLFHSLYDPASDVYVTQLSCELQGELNVSAFAQAWQQVVNRHSVLRTAFVWEKLEKPLQIVGRHVKLDWEEQDWQSVPPIEQKERLENLLDANRKRGFELSKAPLMRLILIKLAETHYHFVWSHHHLLLDGWSLPIIVKEVIAYYEGFCQGQIPELKLPCPYRNYIAWLQQQDMSQAKAFWREKFKGFTAPTPLEVGQASLRFPNLEENYDEQEIKLSIALTAALKSLAQQQHLTLNTLIQGAWGLLLSCYSTQDDVVFGATVSGRPSALLNVESMVGLLINTLPIRVQVAPDEFLLPWLKHIQAQYIEMGQYEYSPLVEIHGWSEIPRDLPLFESLVIFENYPIESSLRERVANLKVDNIRAFEKTNYPLSVFAIPGEELELKIAYNCHRFDAATIIRMLGHLQTLLEGMVANPKVRLSDLPRLTQAERHQLLVEWNDTQADYPHNQCIHQLFEAQVEKTPDAVAVVFEGQQLTYRELNARANQLAHHLQKLGVKPEVLVGICVERSLHMVIGLLGILKAGGAYVPLDPAYPQERLAFMFSDAQVQVLLTVQHLVERVPEHEAQVVYLDADWGSIAQESQENLVSSSTANNLAYVIYTSGSTGKPKGVLGLHQGAVNRFHWMWETYPFEAEEVCCQKTSLNFVDSVWEIFGPLLQGVRIVIVSDQVLKDPQQFVETLADNAVTRLVLVPSLLRVLLDTASDLQKRLPKLKLWVTSGEALSVDLLQKFRQIMSHRTLLNLYGSSEVSADVTCYSISPQDKAPSHVSIGRPIANTQIYVLDRHLKPAPIGVPGELYVGGAGLARGYLNRPEMTAERFIPNPFNDLELPIVDFRLADSNQNSESCETNAQFRSPKSSVRLYKTGDLVRYLPDGNLEFLGRIDNQVKLRGFRIELGEIEAVLGQHPGVREAVVLAREDESGNQQLVAYVVSDLEQWVSEAMPLKKRHEVQAIAISELHRLLKQKLPNYMVPSAFVMLEALPLLPNGKVDHRALPMPDERSRPELEAAYQAPRTEVEQTIATIWQEVLHVEEIGIHDNFFELGGHSLLLVQVHGKLQKTFQRDFPLVGMFQYPTISYLAQYLSQEQSKQPSSSQSSNRSGSRTDSINRRKQVRQKHRAAGKPKSTPSQ